MAASGKDRLSLTIIVVPLVLLLASCILYRTDRSYAGIPLKDVIANSGEPTEITTLADGRKVARYDWKDSSASASQQRACTVEFIVDIKDVIESQIVTGNNCAALKAKLRL